jgi:Domain of unknown function (DUF4188)
VFLIGMRVNSWVKVHKWFPVAVAMPRMLKELYTHPELGFLGGEFSGIGNPTVMMQYWRSFQALQSYAKSPDQAHLPAWAAFNRRVKNSGTVGIWHETFLVRAGEYETIYSNMPPFGLGKASSLIAVEAKSESAADRLKH